MKYKKIIAREWLLILSVIIFGFVSNFTYKYLTTLNMDEKRNLIFEELVAEGNFETGTYNNFCQQIENDDQRLIIYNAISETYDVGDYKLFTRKVIRSKFINVVYDIFDANRWSLILLFILIPYVAIQLLRTIFWSIKIVKTS